MADKGKSSARQVPVGSPLGSSGSASSSKSKSKKSRSKDKVSPVKRPLVSVFDPVSKESLRVSIDPPASMPVLSPQEKETQAVSRDELFALFSTFKDQMREMLATDRGVSYSTIPALPPGVGNAASLSRIVPSATVTSADVADLQLSASADQVRVSGSWGCSAHERAVHLDGYSTLDGGSGPSGPSYLGSTATARGYPATGSLSGDRGTSCTLPSASGSQPTGVPVVGGNGNPFPAFTSAQAAVDGGRQDGLASGHSTVVLPVAFSSGLPATFGSSSTVSVPLGVATQGSGAAGASVPFRDNDASGHDRPSSDVVIDDVDVGEDCDDSSEAERIFRVQRSFSRALSAAAEVTSRYFAEGVSTSSSRLAAPPSAFGDFRGDSETGVSFRFRESPAVAYHMAKVLSVGADDIVPLLSAHGDAPESAQQWLASPSDCSRFQSNLARRPKLFGKPVHFIDSFALPSSPLQVTPELANLRKEGYKKEKLSVCTEAGVIAVEEAGRVSLELASVSDTLIRALSRSISVSLEPFKFRDDAVEEDVVTLLAALAKIAAEQTATSAKLYTQAVLWRREALLKDSRLSDKATIDALKLSPFAGQSLLGPESLEALRRESQEVKDLHFVKLSELALKQGQKKGGSAPPSSFRGSGQKTRSHRGGNRSRPYNKRPSFGKKGSGGKPNPQ